MSIKIVRLPLEKMPSYSFTDRQTIFICEELSGREFEFVKKHELCHIFLYHNLRSPLKDWTQVDVDQWTLAMELEIARNFYTEVDDCLLTDSFSILHGGIKADHVPELPADLKIAEHIYHWLVANKKEDEKDPEKDDKDDNENDSESEEEKSKDTCKGCCASSQIKKKLQKLNPENQQPEDKQTFSKEEIDQLLSGTQQSVNDFEYEIKTISTKKNPTLGSVIDYMLRKKNVRNRSYARESRIKVYPFLMKGRRTIKKTPAIEVFVDRSGSFNQEKTAYSLKVIDMILKKYNVKIKCDFFYFSNGNLYDHDIESGGGTPYKLVINHINLSRPKIAIIITDDDYEDGLTFPEHTHTKILCVPIGCFETKIATKINGMDVQLT